MRTMFIRVPIAQSEAMGRALGAGYARQVGREYPIEGTNQGGGKHTPPEDSQTIYAVPPCESLDGTEVAFELVHDLDGADLRLEKGRGYNGVTIPATDHDLPDAWFKVPPRRP